MGAEASPCGHRLLPELPDDLNQIRSTRAASSVPITRDRILLKAVSRGVDMSSLNGAKSQSSVVPN